jgi:hypothetical protein
VILHGPECPCRRLHVSPRHAERLHCRIMDACLGQCREFRQVTGIGQPQLQLPDPERSRTSGQYCDVMLPIVGHRGVAGQ